MFEDLEDSLEDLEELENSLKIFENLLYNENLEKLKKEEYEVLRKFITIDLNLLEYIEQNTLKTIENLTNILNQKEILLKGIDYSKIGNIIIKISQNLNQILKDFINIIEPTNTEIFNAFQKIKKLQKEISKFNNYHKILAQEKNNKDFTLLNLDKELKEIEINENIKEKVIPNFF